MGYNTWGRVEAITQHDDEVAGQGSVVDEVKFTYDDWGNVTTFEQDVNSADRTIASNNTGATLGYGALSDVGNRFGYSGHEYENALSDSAPLRHARSRVLHNGIGRWLTRDRARNIDGPNLYAYGSSNPCLNVDSFGLFAYNLGCDDCRGMCTWLKQVCDIEYQIILQVGCYIQDADRVIQDTACNLDEQGTEPEAVTNGCQGTFPAPYSCECTSPVPSEWECKTATRDEWHYGSHYGTGCTIIFKWKGTIGYCIAVSIPCAATVEL